MSRSKSSRKAKEAGQTDAPEKRGAKSRWTQERLDLLLKWLPAYLEIKGDNTKSRAFWKDFLDEWFDMFPYHDKDEVDVPEGLSDEERDAYLAAERDRLRNSKDIRKQLSNFFNHERTKLKTTSARPFVDFFEQCMRHVASKPRRDATWQFYLSLDEYNTDVKREARRRWEAAGKPKGDYLKFQNAAAMDMFKEESKEVQEDVDRRAREDYEQRLEDWENGIDFTSMSDEQKREYRSNITSIAEPIINDLLMMCGFTAGVLLCGRPPKPDDPDYDTLIIPVGKTIPQEGSLNFSQWKAQIFREVVVRHFLQFVNATTEFSAKKVEDSGESTRTSLPLSLLHKGDGQQAVAPSDPDNTTATPPSDLHSGKRAVARAEGSSGQTSHKTSAVTNAGKKTKRSKGKVSQGARRKKQSRADDRELTHTETENDGDDFSSRSNDEETDSSGQSSSSESDTESVPTDDEHEEERSSEEDLPPDIQYTKDWRGREFSAALRDRINKMPPRERAAFVRRLSNESYQELTRQNTIAASKAELERNGCPDTMDDILEIARGVIKEGEAADAQRRVKEAEERAREKEARAAKKTARAAKKTARESKKTARESRKKQKQPAAPTSVPAPTRRSLRNREHHANTGSEGRAGEEGAEGHVAGVESARPHDADASASTRAPSTTATSTPTPSAPTASTPATTQEHHPANDSAGEGENSRELAEQGDAMQVDTCNERSRPRRDELTEGSEVIENGELTGDSGGLQAGDDLHQLQGAEHDRGTRGCPHAPATTSSGESSAHATPDTVPAADGGGGAAVLGGQGGDGGGSESTRSQAGESSDSLGAGEGDGSSGAGRQHQGGRRGKKRKSTRAQEVTAGHDEQRALSSETQAPPQGDVSTLNVAAEPVWVKTALENFGSLPSALPNGQAQTLWLRVIQEWQRFERSKNYAGDKNLPTCKVRPPEIATWIKSWRAASYEPKTPEAPDDYAAYVATFKQKMRLWWARLNPVWRPRSDGLLTGRSGSGPWDSLHYSGPNGLQSLLKGLHWWFMFEKRPEGSIEWLEVVQDVAWALQTMNNEIESSEPPSKRTKT